MGSNIVKIGVYTKELALTKVGTGAENIDDNPVKPNQRIIFNSIAVEDETSALTYIRIGKVVGGKFHPWEELKTPTAGELAFSTEEHVIAEGEYFRAVLNGGVANDKCRVYLDGWRQYLE